MERHPWLLRLVRGRLDPATATGLALTLALGLAIVGGILVGLLAYLMRSSDRLVDTDREVGQWGVDNATSWSTDALQLVTELGGTYFVVFALIVVAVFEYRRVPNRWVPVFLVTVVAARSCSSTRSRRSSTACAPSSTRSPRHSGRRSRAATPGWRLPSTRQQRWCSRASDRRGRARCSRAARSRSPSVWRAAGCSSASTGCRTSSRASRSAGPGSASCAIAFGGRFLVLGAPVEQAAEIAEERGVDAGAGPTTAGQTS